MRQRTYSYILFVLSLCMMPMVHAAEQQNKKNEKEIALLMVDVSIKELKGNVQEAIEGYTDIIAKYPEAIEAYLQRGFLLKQKGEEAKAQDDFDKGLAIIAQRLESNENNARLYYLRGRANRYMEKYDQAIADTKKAVELDPSRSSYPLDLRAIEVEKKLYSK